MVKITWDIADEQRHPNVDIEKSKQNLLNIVVEEQQRFHPEAQELVIHWQVPERRGVRVDVYDAEQSVQERADGKPMRPIWEAWKWVVSRETAGSG